MTVLRTFFCSLIRDIDLHAPGWLVVVIAVGAVALGNYAISVRKKTLPIQSMGVEVQVPFAL